MIDDKTLKKLVVISVVLVLAILTILLIWYIALSIIAGLILAYIFHPVYKKVLRGVREKNISALIIVIAIIFIIFIPIWLIFPSVVRQILDAYTYFQRIDISSALKMILPPSLSADTLSAINSFTSNITSSLLSQVSRVFVNIPNIILQAAVILFVFFFSLRDGDKLIDYVKKVSPFSPELEHNLSKNFKDVTNSVLFGHVIVGILQGLLTGLGLWIFGVPHVALFTLFACLAAVLPVIGAWLVWIPASVYLLTTGHTGAGIGLFLYGALFVSWVDNILKPYIVSKKTNLNSGLVFIGMIGGLYVFGILGIILGPLIIAYLRVFLDAYKNKRLSKFFN